jgi:30S ribosomal protein S31
VNNVESSHVPAEIMGKGDKRTRKGKIWNGSYGKARPKKPKKGKKKK